MSRSGVKIIDRGAREIFPMSQRAGMFDDECDECGASSWTEDPSTGARTCELCGGQTDGPNFDTSAPNWTAEEPGTRSSRSKRSEWIGGISNRRLAKARPAGDALRYDSQKIMEVKEEIRRMVVEENARNICRSYADALQNGQKEYLSSGGKREHLLIGVGMRPAGINTFCVAAAIVIRYERDKAGSARAFDGTELLERVSGEYCEDGKFVFREPGETYRLDPTRSHTGMGKTLLAMITEYCVNLDRIWPPSHLEMKRNLMGARGDEAKARRAELMRMEQRNRIRDHLGLVQNAITRCSVRGGYEQVGNFHGFQDWCTDNLQVVDGYLQKNAKPRTKKIFAFLVAANFLDCDSGTSVVRMMGVSGSINNPTKENMKQMIAAWGGNLAEGLNSDSEGDES